MIKERTYYVAVCDKCGTEIPAEAASALTARDLAIANKWKVTVNEFGVETMLCPMCKDGRKKTWFYGG